MKKSLLAIATVVCLGMFTSCNQGGSGAQRYTYIRGKQGVIVMDTQTGQMYRMQLKPDGGTIWSSLGSPEDAK